MFKLIKKLIKVIAIIIAGLFALIFVAAMFSDGTPRAEETAKPSVEFTALATNDIPFMHGSQTELAQTICNNFSNKEGIAGAWVLSSFKGHSDNQHPNWSFVNTKENMICTVINKNDNMHFTGTRKINVQRSAKIFMTLGNEDGTYTVHK